MNSTLMSLNGAIPTECVMVHYLGGTFDYTNTETYAVLVFLIAVSIITCPFTVLFNALVITAVKIKPRLKSNSNIVLGCLAVTDGLMGVLTQPMVVGTRISTLQGNTSKDYCIVDQFTRNVIRLCCAASILHLVMMNGERYLAIKHSLTYAAMVTKARILISSAVAWILAVLGTIPLVVYANDKIYLTTNNSFLAGCLAFIVYCQVAVYAETRRHEKEIAAQQISVEARKKFLNEKKALKITTTVLLVLLLSYSPIFVVRILLVSKIISSVNVSYICLYIATFVAILNSLMNPVIYCIRIRQFRVAFIEILLRKNVPQAEQLERRMLGKSDMVVPLEAGLEMDGEAQNDDQEILTLTIITKTTLSTTFQHNPN